MSRIEAVWNASRPSTIVNCGRPDVLGGGKGPVLMAVDGLDDRLARPQVRQMLAQDVQVVAVRVQRGETALGPLLAVVAVVVVGRDVRDLVLAEDPNQPARQRRLARRGVADDAEQDRVGASGAATYRRAGAKSQKEIPRHPDEESPMDRGAQHKSKFYQITENQYLTLMSAVPIR